MRELLSKLLGREIDPKADLSLQFNQNFERWQWLFLLLGVAAFVGLKIVLYDLSQMKALYRVGSFFALAIIALAVAYAYNRRAKVSVA